MSSEGQGMKEKRLKIADIASITGLTEEEVRHYATEYQALLPSRKFGRIRLYDEKAAEMIADIAASSAKGREKEAISAEYEQNKPRKRIRAREERKGPTSSPAEGMPAFAAPERAAMQYPPAVEERIALQERQIKRLKDRIHTQERDHRTSIRNLEAQITQMQQIMENQHQQIDNISEWIGYFNGTLDSQRSQIEHQASITREWIDYVEEEIGLLKRPFPKKMVDSLKKQ